MIAWASAHPVLAAWLCAGVFFAACAAFTALFLRLTRDPGQRASGERPAVREAPAPPSLHDGFRAALAMSTRAEDGAHEDAPMEAPGEMPADQDDPGPLYSDDNTIWKGLKALTEESAS